MDTSLSRWARALELAKVVPRLGTRSLARVAGYRLQKAFPYSAVRQLRATAPEGPLFREGACLAAPAAEADDQLEVDFFGWTRVRLPADWDWAHSPLPPHRGVASDLPWHRVPLFAPGLDIKEVWEASRFSWVLELAQQHLAGDARATATLNRWLRRWITANPPYRGPNWFCGQEASIRVLHLLLAAQLLQQDATPEGALQDFVALHLRRIVPTMSYAIGQDNNHGTSEAAALFVGGAWLAQRRGGKEAQGWASVGRYWLQERAQALIEPDGSFSQQSVTYHRFMLDTYSFAEVWRRRLAQPPWSPVTYDRLRAAAAWLRQFTDARSGDAPNYGPNDGARMVPLGGFPYRDFRPSVALAYALFMGQRAWDQGGPWEEPARLLGVGVPRAAAPPPVSQTFDDGGYHVLRVGEAVAYLRYPRHRTRPSHADALHLDLWVGGQNLLVDGGSYSYNAAPDDFRYFRGVWSHNTVSFDERDQMPLLRRFLYGGWLDAGEVEACSGDGPREVRASARYEDWRGASHRRQILLTPSALVCKDMLGGQAKRAVLRWRLGGGPWHQDGGGLVGPTGRMDVSVEGVELRRELVVGWTSLHYLERQEVRVLEVEMELPARVTTTLTFTPGT